jgi:hypothetical protein
MEMRHIGWKGVLRYKTLTAEESRMSLTVAVDHKNPNMASAHIAQAVTVPQGMSTTTESSSSKQQN